MHITLAIQNVLQLAFIILIAAPLPILLLTSPVQYLNEKITQKRYYRIVKKHFTNPYTVNVEQLKDIFPRMNPEKLDEIVSSLHEAGAYHSIKIT
jgi:hypothetical protein